MKSWPDPPLPAIAGDAQPLRMFNTSSRVIAEVTTSTPVRLYVCGITPYDATHLGHAATYIAFDLAIRVLRDNGHEVNYTQNVTDIDDPLLERAARDHVRWEDLATREIELFRTDMTALRVIPPSHYVGVVEAMPIITELVQRTLAAGTAYEVSADDAVGPDLYVDLTQVPSFGEVSGWSRDQMMAVFAERGGDPDRPGKRNPLDPLLWRAARAGEPSWSASGLPDGRPGWHVECTAIALDRLGTPLDINAGGSDLIFPHHEMSAAQASAIGVHPYAALHAHAGMVGLDGRKMSKSRGNLVLVSKLRSVGADPMAIRLVLLAHHYRSDWDYTPAQLDQATDRLATWRAARDAPGVQASRETDAQLVDQLRAALADDLDAPRALAAVDAWVGQYRPLGDLAADALDALLGIQLSTSRE